MNIEKPIITLQKEQAYRVHDPIDVIYLTLLDGTAEIFGRELLLYFLERNQSYRQLFTFHNIYLDWRQNLYFLSVQQISYVINQRKKTNEDPGEIYNEEEFPYNKMMYQIAKLNHVLTCLRLEAQQQWTELGPRVLIIGNKFSGKSTLFKTIINYGNKYGWKPIQVDLDSDQQSLGNPSCIVASINQIYGSNNQKISFYFGHQSNQQFSLILSVKVNDQGFSLYKQLVKQLGNLVGKRLNEDLVQQQQRYNKFKQEFMSSIQNNKNDNQFIQQSSFDEEAIIMGFKQIQQNLDEKNVYSSGCIINCPFFQGKPNIVQNLLIEIIQAYLINMIIVIDLPDTYRELDQLLQKQNDKKVSLIKWEKLRGVSQYQNPYDQMKELISNYQWIEKVKKNDIMLYELEMKDGVNIKLNRVKENMVQLVVGILHLEKKQIMGVSEEKLTEQIIGSPLGFLAQVDDYQKNENTMMVLIPGEQYRKYLHENVWINGNLTYARR